MKWVGPTPPKYGAASLLVTVGSAGILNFKVDYGRDKEFGCRDWKDESGTPWNGTVLYGRLCDERDSQAYRTVRMGNQVWMAQDLIYSGADGRLGSCDIATDPNCQFSGRSYTWVQAMAVPDSFLTRYWPIEAAPHQGICPAGWHIPQLEEWRTLRTWAVANAAGGSYGSLRAVEGWPSATISGTDQYGFHALPRRRNESSVYWWTLDRSADPGNPSQGSLFMIEFFGATVETNTNKLRCLQD